MEQAERMTRAKFWLTVNQPFFATLALSMNAQETESIPTMATDGESLFWSPRFTAGLSDEEIRGVIAHEAMHVALLHHTRRGGRDPELWNVAADHAINLQLLSEGFTLPKGRLADARFAGMATERIYAILEGERRANPPGKPGPGSPGSDPGGCGGVIDAAPGSDPAEIAKAEAGARSKVFQAAAAAKARGKESGLTRSLVADARQSRKDWRDALRRYVSPDAARKAWTWSKPNRRMISAGLYLPGTVPDGLSEIIAIVDTSGSIDAKMLGAFKAELGAAFDESGADRLTVLQCDTEIRGEHSFAAFEPVDFPFCGGGSTRLSPALRAVAERGAAVCIVFTDLECEPDPFDPACPVLWVRWGGGGIVPAFGEVTDID